MRAARRSRCLLVAALVAACAPERVEQRSALLITIDTTIPEALSCYGVARGTTPHLDALAAEGVLYENARTVTPITAPAHASILTGLYPLRHAVRMNGSMVLPEAATTLAERARARGFQTAAVVAAVVLLRDFGLDQGFDLYDDAAERGGADRRAEEVADHAIRWLEHRDPARPFLLWAHFFDAHQPHRAPESFVERTGNPYLAEVAYMDHHIGRLLDYARAEGLLDEALVVVVADHGEGLGRHGEATHAAFGFDTTLSVPLIVRHPDGWGAGTRSPDVTSVVDVYSTLVEGMGLGPPGDVDGYSLFRRGVAADRGVYFETYFGFLSFGWSQLTGWADAEGKYLFSSAPEFYPVDRDPDEKENRIDRLGAGVERYRGAIETLAGRPRLDPDGLGGAGDEREELQEQIEKLGYAGVGSETFALPRPLEVLDRPSPHERIRVYQDFLESRSLLKDHDLEGAAAALQRVVERDPQNHTAYSQLGNVLLRLGRHREAVAALERAIALRDDEWITPYFKLGVCYDELGEPEKAIESLRRGFAYGVGPVQYRELLIELLTAAGRGEEARQYREAAGHAGR